MRPAVVWFGENLPQQAWMRAQQLCMALDCLLVTGTSASVYPAAGLVELARRYDSKIIVVDPNPGAAGNVTDPFSVRPSRRWIRGQRRELMPA